MSNEEILNQRWSKTDKTLKSYLKHFNNLGKDTIDDLIEMFDSLDITYNDLNKSISKAEKRRLDKKIKEWKKKSLLTGYFGYLVSSKTKITYADLLEILIYAIYVSQEEKTKELSQEVFTIVAEDIYFQALNELPPFYKTKKKFSLTWEFIWSLLWIPTYNKSWDSYLQLLTLTNEQEAYKQIIAVIQQDKPLTENLLKDLVKKQINRIISINDDKYSGVLSDTCRQLGNKVYTEPFNEDKSLQVRFIAEIDKRTTKMCKGMDNMLFYVNDWNKFYRYSDVDGKDVLYTCKGLEQGINLPPITNHFHWCRSTITYLLEDDVADMVRDNIKVANETDKKQYERYKKYFEDMLEVDDVEKFTKMKYNNPDEWNYLKQNYTYARHRYNEIQKKKLDPNISVKDYIDKVHEIRRELLDYELYNGESIKDISLHFYDRVIGNPEENRIGVSIANIKNTLSNMVDTKPRENGSVMIIGKNAKVSYNPKKMRLITPIPGGKK